MRNAINSSPGRARLACRSLKWLLLSMAAVALPLPAPAVTAPPIATHVGGVDVWGYLPGAGGGISVNVDTPAAAESVDVAAAGALQFGHATATASATNGSLRTFAAASYGFFPSAGVIASASVFDEFVIQGLPAGSPITLSAFLSLTGLLSIGATPAGGSSPMADVDAGFFGIGSSKEWNLDSASASFVTVDYQSLARTVSSIDPSIPNERLVLDSVSSPSFTVYAGQPFTLSYFLITQTNSQASADFRSTAQLQFVLPDGTNIQSTGGFFQTTLVPEPPRWPLLVAGLPLLGWRLLRRSGADYAATSSGVVTGPRPLKRSSSR